MDARWIGAVIGCSYLVCSMAVHAAACGDLKADAAGYGPWNYNDPWAQKHKIPRVVTAHFTPPVANLVHGNTGTIGQDIDYTLRHIPNHPRALDSMARLAIRQKTVVPTGSHYTMKCWFQRAKTFASDDGVVWMVQGMYQNMLGHRDSAIAFMRKGAELEPNNPNIHYNLGLLYADAGKYEKAREQAHLAYQQGFPLLGLKQKLSAVGQWDKGSGSEKNVTAKGAK
ncbi:MAG: tetratricopeptide repeat protein [Nitrococcus sp.]|nr:tetratricopeptide repeat protein [Nitrococcus sp.]